MGLQKDFAKQEEIELGLIIFLVNCKPLISVQTSRGCSYDCTYCPYMVVQTPQWRKRTPENVVDEIEYLIKEFGIRSIVFRDPLFTMDMERVKKLCQEIRRWI